MISFKIQQLFGGPYINKHCDKLDTIETVKSGSEVDECLKVRRVKIS